MTALLLGITPDNFCDTVADDLSVSQHSFKIFDLLRLRDVLHIAGFVLKIDIREG